VSDSAVELADLVAELCDGRQHIEPIWEYDAAGNKRMRRAWTTNHPGLLTQLRAFAHEGLRVGSRSPASVGKPASRPPGCFDALSAHHYISTQAVRWMTPYQAPRPEPEANVQALVGLVDKLDEVDLARLVGEVRYWRGMAATCTGWIERPYTPPVRCPICHRFGSLRVNIEGRTGYCTNRDRRPDGGLVCGSSWPPGMAGQLFDWVRSELGAAA
jgi:hypothetical protein